MKIPGPEGGQVRTRAQPALTSNLNFNDGTGALQQGLGQLAGGIENVLSVNAELAAKAREKAVGAASDSGFAQAQDKTTNLLHGYDEAPVSKPEGTTSIDTLTVEDLATAGEPGKHVEGYLDSRGHQAYEKASGVTEELQKFYDSLLAAAPNEETKAHLGKRLDALKASVHQQIAVHEGQQLQVAQQLGTKALLDTTLRTAANLYDNDAQLKPFIDDALASLQKSSLPEEFEAKKTEYLSQVSKAMIGKYIAAGDLTGAEARLKTDEKVLGDDAPKMLEVLTAKKKAAAKDASELVSQDVMGQAVARLRNGYDFIEPGAESKLREVAMARPPAEREEALATAERYIRMEAEQRDAKVKSWRSQMQSLRTTGRRLGEMPSELLVNLQKYDPDYILSVQAHELAEARHWKASRSGDARERSAAKAQQTAWDLQYRYRLEARLAEDPTTKPSDVLVELVAERAKDGEDMTVSQTELERGGASSAKTVKQAGTTLGEAKKRFADEFGVVLRAKVKPSERGAKIDEELQQQRKGNAASEYQSWVDANGGKPLDATAAAELKARLLKDAITDPGDTFLGIRYGVKKGVAADLVKPRASSVPAEKSIKSYAYSPDKKQRRPRYSDGTLGPPEQVP